MEIEEAKRRLSFHSARNGELENPLWENGFVRLLRPFRGQTHLETAFHEVVQIIHVLEDCLQEEALDKEMIANMWAIVHLGKSWGNNAEMFTAYELERIAYFAEQISYLVFCLLDGTDRETAFEMYGHDYPEKVSLLQDVKE